MTQTSIRSQSSVDAKVLTEYIRLLAPMLICYGTFTAGWGISLYMVRHSVSATRNAEVLGGLGLGALAVIASGAALAQRRRTGSAVRRFGRADQIVGPAGMAVVTAIYLLSGWDRALATAKVFAIAGLGVWSLSRFLQFRILEFLLPFFALAVLVLLEVAIGLSVASHLFVLGTAFVLAGAGLLLRFRTREVSR